MNDDDRIYVEFSLDRASLKVINEIIGVGVDEFEPLAEQHQLEEAHAIFDMLRDKANEP
jgi:hypothetical protein